MQKDYSEFDKRKEILRILFENEIDEADFELEVAGSSGINKYEKEGQDANTSERKHTETNNR
jgi:hypothetical protein